MKDRILELIKSYYNKRAIIRDVVISEQKGVRTINVFDNLAANKWKLVQQDQTTPNTEEADRIIMKERREIAQQLYRLANRKLLNDDKMGAWLKLYGNPMPKIEEQPDLLIDWVIGAFDFTKVITFHEYEVQEPLMDEQGILLANKMIPKKPADEWEETE